ncbi:hypothetical protein Tco_1078257 [Tanacetum coccineum]
MYSCNPGIGSNNLLWKVITRLQVISDDHLDVAVMKHMASNFAKLDKFEGVNFRRWQKKMHFLLSSMSVVYVLTTPILEDVVMMQPWNKSGKGPSGTMMTMSAEDSLEAKYMAEDASSKKFLVSNFINYKMTDLRPVMEQYIKLLGILGRFTQHKMNMDEAIQEELTLVELGNHLRIEESLKVQDNDKPKGNNVAGPPVARLLDPKQKTLGKRAIKCIYVGYSEHSKAFRFASSPTPSLRILNRTEDIGGSVVPEEVTKEVDGTIEKFKASTIRRRIAMAAIHNLIIHQMDVKTTFLNGDLDEEVDLTKEFLSSRFSMKDIGEADVIFGILVTLCWKASKKQTCITGSTMESEFVALAAVCKESEWLQNLLLEISLWSKPIAPISIRCDSAATLAKAYSQMYNGKSRHLGVRHSMIHELITNGMVSIEFVRSQQNLADHLTKGLARD